MPEITLSRIGTLLRGVLELLWNKPEGLPASEILAFLPELTPLTEYEKGYSPSTNVPRYEQNRAASHLSSGQCWMAC